MDIKQVFDEYDSELRLVNDRLMELFESSVPLIPLVGKYLLDSGGKKLRPLFLLSSARISGYKGDEHLRLAAIVELIHMSSLLHDDVVDGAQIRRGKSAANSIWGNQIVILVGDFLYSNALKSAVSFKNQEIMESLSGATTAMTEGEILQLQKTADIDITEEEYLRIISAKTGELISASCRIGAILGARTNAEKKALAGFGLKAGAAFQMADDILDYMADENELGKKLGKDFEESKITLPLIYLFESADENERKEIKAVIDVFSESSLNKVLTLFKKYNVLDKSLQRAREMIEEAKAELSVFPDSKEKEYMFSLADYAVLREK
ncbi:MAG: polyprenyl synthetase family protein [Nitrospiraceae bacterium]|nr:polyprenyl synthetase family protein [Nitrospiraceae bacterium]